MDNDSNNDADGIYENGDDSLAVQFLFSFPFFLRGEAAERGRL